MSVQQYTHKSEKNSNSKPYNSWTFSCNFAFSSAYISQQYLRNFSVLLYVKILYTLGHLIKGTSTSVSLKQPKWLNWLRRMTVKVRMHGSNPVSPFFYFINFTAKVCTNYVRRYVNFSYWLFRKVTHISLYQLGQSVRKYTIHLTNRFL